MSRPYRRGFHFTYLSFINIRFNFTLLPVFICIHIFFFFLAVHLPVRLDFCFALYLYNIILSQLLQLFHVTPLLLSIFSPLCSPTILSPHPTPGSNTRSATRSIGWCLLVVVCVWGPLPHTTLTPYYPTPFSLPLSHLLFPTYFIRTLLLHLDSIFPLIFFSYFIVNSF